MMTDLLLVSPVALLLLFGGVTLVWFVLAPLLSPQRSIPGPFLARFTRLWYFYQIYQGGFERLNVKLHEQYGPIVRIAPGEYSIDDVEGARVIYGLGKGFIKVCLTFNWRLV